MSGDLKHRLVAILAADVAGYSRLMAGNEPATVAALEEARNVFRLHTAYHQGRVIDMAGDSVLAVFETAAGAVNAALAIQRELETASDAQSSDRQMRFRIGVHLGDVIEKADGSVYGDGVNIAARLQTAALPGSTWISDAVRGAVKARIHASFEDMGEQQMKNIAEPVRAFQVSTSDVSRLSAEHSRSQDPPPTLPDRPSIVVLPFANLSGDADQDYFSDGIVEDLITALSRFRWLFVIARNSSFAYKGQAVEISKAGRELGVRYVVEGSVRKVQHRVRIAARLIDSTNGAHIWADKYDHELDDIFKIQDDVTASIVGALAPEVAAAEILRAHQRTPKSVSAWDAYLRALPLMREHSKEAWEKATKMLEVAIDLAPDFAAAYARLSACYTQAAYFGWSERAERSIAQALELAQKSSVLDSNEPLAFDALASVYQFTGDNASAEASARRAIALSPTCTAAYGTLISTLAFSDRADEAIAVYLQSERISPRDLDRSSRLLGLANAYFVAEKYDEAIAAARQYSALRPNWYGGHVILAAALALSGEIAAAQSISRRISELVPHFNLTRARKRPLFRGGAAERLFKGLRLAGLPD